MTSLFPAAECMMMARHVRGAACHDARTMHARCTDTACPGEGASSIPGSASLRTHRGGRQPSISTATLGPANLRLLSELGR